jgi:hypothetical protein
MKTLITTLKFISIGLGLLSFFFLIFSLTTLLQFDNSVNFINSVDNIYKALATYSGLYKFTFIVCAFGVTLQQLEISFGNYNTTLKQVKFVQDDIIERRKKDITNETLKQCNFFLNELQVSFKEFIETDILNGIMSQDLPLLEPLTSSSLNDKYPNLFEKLNTVDRSKKNQALITLYKLEAFSSLFIHGNLDRQLAKEIIGHTFSKQVGFLLGVISYFRKDEKAIFGMNTIKLYNEWKTDENK